MSDAEGEILHIEFEEIAEPDGNDEFHGASLYELIVIRLHEAEALEAFAQTLVNAPDDLIATIEQTAMQAREHMHEGNAGDRASVIESIDDIRRLRAECAQQMGEQEQIEPNVDYDSDDSERERNTDDEPDSEESDEDYYE